AALADAVVHEARQAGKRVDGWVDAQAVEGPAQDQLPFGDVAGEVRDRVRDVVVRHRPDGKLGDRPLLPLDPAGPLVDTGQVGVHVPGVAPASRDLLAGRADFPERFTV